LEEKLLSADKRMGGLILKILDGLNMLTKESSLSYLDSFMKSCDINKIVERKYLNKAKKIKKNILDFNQSTNENRKILIEDALFSDNNSSDPRWAMDKIRQSRDRAYLPLLRKANSHLNSMKPAYFSKTSLIKLMLYLGEKKFEKRDLLMLNRIKEFNEKGREMTMELLRKPLYKGNRKGGDF